MSLKGLRTVSCVLAGALTLAALPAAAGSPVSVWHAPLHHRGPADFTGPAATTARADEALLGPVERQVLALLTPEQTDAWLAGTDPADIWLAQGANLASVLERLLAAAGPPLVFRSLPGCVLVDTRKGGGPMSPPETRDFFVAPETADLSAQGGSALGCGVPSSAKALMVNVKGMGRVGRVVLSVFPFGGSPGTAVLNFDVAETRYVNNAITTGVARDQISVRAGSPQAGTSVGVLLTVLGYFEDAPVGLTEYEQVSELVTLGPAGSEDERFMNCPAGKVPLGGGHVTPDGVEELRVWRNGPLNPAQGAWLFTWTVLPGGEGRWVNLVVLCAKAN